MIRKVWVMTKVREVVVTLIHPSIKIEIHLLLCTPESF